MIINLNLLTTFYETLKYLTSEVFPNLNDGHEPPIDVWPLGVIVLEWIYGIPTPPDAPKPKKNRTQVMPTRWYDWVENWSTQLLDKLEDEDEAP